MKHSSLAVRLLPVLFLTLPLAACSKVTLANYERLKAGQSYEEVTAIIGEPTRCDETVGVRQCVWGSDERGISGNFLAGKALLFSAKGLQ